MGVMFFLDPWLPGHRLKLELSVHQRALLGAEDMTVGELIRNRAWALPPLPVRTYMEVWEAVNKVPLLTEHEDDRLFWSRSVHK